MPEVMRAVVVPQYGPAQVLRLEDVPVPVMGAQDVLVEVTAAGVNPLDCRVRDAEATRLASVCALSVTLLVAPHRCEPATHAPSSRAGCPRSFWAGSSGEPCVGVTPGVVHLTVALRRRSGTVAAVGPGVRHIQPGIRVFGAVSPLLPRGSHARYVSVPAEDVAAVPSTWTDVTAAALPFAALTAWRALRRAAPVSLRGKTVLVLGAGGGVGSAAVQIAVAEGAAEVHATAGAHSSNRVAAYGASTVGDSAAALPDIAAQLGWPRFDVVLDTRQPSAGSGEHQALGLCAQHRGHYVTLHGKLVDTLDAYGLLLGLPQAAAHLLSRQSQVAGAYEGVTYHWAAMRTDTEAWAQLAGWAHSGLLAPHVGPVFTWDRAAEAHEAVEAGRTSGRVMLTIVDEARAEETTTPETRNSDETPGTSA